MITLFGNKRRKALSKTFLNVFTLLIPISITSELFMKYPTQTRIFAWIALVSVLLFGWLMTPEESSTKEKED